MKFTKKPPKTSLSGYIWYVDTEYPVPKIGFWEGWNNILYLDTGCRENKVFVYDSRIIEHYRFGEIIEEPDTRTNEVEY